MDLSSHVQFTEVDEAEVAQQVAIELERQKAEREVDLMLPALAGSLSLVIAAWFAGALLPMLAVVIARIAPDYAAQTIARGMVARIAAGRDYRAHKIWAERNAILTGAGWGLALWATHGATQANVAAMLIFISVHLTGVMVTYMTVPSPGTLKRWLLGWLAAIIVPDVLSGDPDAPLLAVTSIIFAAVMLWLSRRLHGQLRDLITLRFKNEALSTEVSVINEALARSLATAENDARRDSLTGLSNRRAFLESAISLHTSCDPHGRHLLLIDIDRFKSINDRFGHGSGDVVLNAIGATLTASMREGECCARWGGEEFVALLLNCGVDQALFRSDQLRRRIEAMRWPDGPADLFPVTASIGVAEWRSGEVLEAVVERADGAMYLAKQSGRNRSQYAGPLAGPGLCAAGV